LSGVLEWHYAIASNEFKGDNPAPSVLALTMVVFRKRRRFRPKVIQPTDVDPLMSKDDIYSAERVNGEVKFIIETNIALGHVDSEQKGKRRKCCAVMTLPANSAEIQEEKISDE